MKPWAWATIGGTVCAICTVHLTAGGKKKWPSRVRNRNNIQQKFSVTREALLLKWYSCILGTTAIKIKCPNKPGLNSWGQKHRRGVRIPPYAWEWCGLKAGSARASSSPCFSHGFSLISIWWNKGEGIMQIHPSDANQQMLWKRAELLGLAGGKRWVKEISGPSQKARENRSFQPAFFSFTFLQHSLFSCSCKKMQDDSSNMY